MNEKWFRAYDKGRKEYLSGGNLFLAINTSKYPNHSEIYLDVISNADKYKDRFIVEQYTGVTDKNGIKIFEGDIVKYCIWGYECFAVVHIGEYEQDGSAEEYPAIKVYGVYVEVIKHRHIIKEDNIYFPNYFKKTSLLTIEIENLEVVGNIHDNPELITTM